MRLQLPNTKYPNPAARQQFFERLTPRLEAMPGAESVAITTSVPPEGAGQRDVEIDGRPIAAGTERRVVTTITISPTFFDTVGAPVLRGRAFGVNDGSPGAETVVVNPNFVSEFFPAEDPIGRRIRFPDREPKPGTPPAGWRTIVGIS